MLEGRAEGQSGSLTSRRWALAFALRALTLLAAWWALAEGRDGLVFAAVATTVIAGVSLRFTPPLPHAPRPWFIPSFMAFFLLQSLRAGLQVSRITLSPSLPVRPALRRPSNYPRERPPGR